MTRNPPTPSRPTRSVELAVGALVVVATIVLVIAIAFVVMSGSRAPTPGPTTGATASDSSSAGSTPSGTLSPPTASGPSPASSASPAAVGVLVGAGDIGDCDTREDSMTAALLDDIDGTVFTAGDNAYEDGSAKEFATCYDDTWGRHRERTRPTPGNHDWHTRELAGYFDYFGDAARGPDGRSWYSFDLGTWDVVMLDSECDKTGGCDADSAQGRWLASDLAASDARCTIAIWHKPRFSSGEHGNDRSVGPFWSALYEAGADVVINGHDHDYERFAPQDPAGKRDGDKGIRQFVVGTGGTRLRRFEDPVANSEVRVAASHGVLKLTLRDGAYDWEFIPVRGDLSDRGTAFCH